MGKREEVDLRLQVARKLGVQAAMQQGRTVDRQGLSWAWTQRRTRTERVPRGRHWALLSHMTLRQSFPKEGGVNPKLPT